MTSGESPKYAEVRFLYVPALPEAELMPPPLRYNHLLKRGPRSWRTKNGLASTGGVGVKHFYPSPPSLAGFEVTTEGLARQLFPCISCTREFCLPQCDICQRVEIRAGMVSQLGKQKGEPSDGNRDDE